MNALRSPPLLLLCWPCYSGSAGFHVLKKGTTSHVTLTLTPVTLTFISVWWRVVECTQVAAVIAAVLALLFWLCWFSCTKEGDNVTCVKVIACVLCIVAGQTIFIIYCISTSLLHIRSPSINARCRSITTKSHLRLEYLATVQIILMGLGGGGVGVLWLLES